MAVQLFRLRGVPEDEADEVRQLLTEHQIHFYETPPDNWGVSMPAIWLADESVHEQAKQLIDEYQLARQARAVEQRQKHKQSGEHKTLLDGFRENPMQFIAYVGFALVILFFSIKPFFDMGR